MLRGTKTGPRPVARRARMCRRATGQPHAIFVVRVGRNLVEFSTGMGSVLLVQRIISFLDPIPHLSFFAPCDASSGENTFGGTILVEELDRFVLIPSHYHRFLGFLDHLPHVGTEVRLNETTHLGWHCTPDYTKTTVVSFGNICQ